MSKKANKAKTGRDYLKEIKETLRMPSREAAAWGSMSINDRSLLVRSAKISQENISLSWERIQPANKQKIREAAKRAAAWVNQLEMI